MKVKLPLEEVAGAGCLALAGIAPPVAGAALTLAGLMAALKVKFADAEERELKRAMKRVVKAARNELELFLRPDDPDARADMAEKNDVRYVVIDHLRHCMPARDLIIQTGFNIDTLTKATVEQLAASSDGRLDPSNPAHAELADHYARAFLTALKAEHAFLEHLGPDAQFETLSEVKALRAEVREVADKVSQRQGVPLGTLRTVARAFDSKLSGQYSEEELIDFLQDKAQEYRTLSAQIGQARNIAPEIAKLRDAAQIQLDEGAFDIARALLKQAREKQRDLRERQEEEASQRRAEEVELLTEEARAAELDLDFGAAGALYLEAVDLRAKDDAKAACDLAFRSAYGFDEEAQRLGDNAGLERAIDLYERALTLDPDGEGSAGWAGTQNNLGLVLQALGARRGDETLLERAIEAYEAALTIHTRDAAPVDWATTQNNLGIVLEVLGERRGDEALVERAVEAYEAALTVRTRDAAPVDWATTQNNLAAALGDLGESRGDEALLERAIEAYEATLTVYTRDAAPVDWAMTQNNLGVVLAVLGARRGDAALLEHSIAACEAALTIRTREAMPVAWAMTQSNLEDAEAALKVLRGGGKA